MSVVDPHHTMSEHGIASDTSLGDMSGVRPVPRITIQSFCESDGVRQTLETAASDRRMSRAHVSVNMGGICLLYTSPSPRDKRQSRMPSSA